MESAIYFFLDFVTLSHLRCRDAGPAIVRRVCRSSTPLLSPRPRHPPPRTPQGTSSAFKPSSTIDREDARGRGTHRSSTATAAARPRMKWSLRTAPTWRTATASTREREGWEREGGPRPVLPSFLPQRRCMDVQLIRPLASPLPSRQFTSRSSSLSCSFFIWHQNIEECSPAARARPRPRSRTHFRRGEEKEGRTGKMRKEGAAGEGGRTTEPPPPFGYISAGGIHGRTRTPGRTRGELGGLA